MGAWTYLVNATRHDARAKLQEEVARLGASGVVVRTSNLKVRQGVCPWRSQPEFIAEVTVIGTAITRFSRSGPAGAGSPAMLSLDLRRPP